MKIECKRKRLPDGIMMHVDTRGQTIYFGGADCKPSYKTVFQPEKRGPSPIDVEHEKFEKCLRRSKAEGFLNEPEVEARIRQGRPVTVWTKPEPVEKKRKFTKATGDIDVIITNITKLQKEIAPYVKLVKDEGLTLTRTEKAESASPWTEKAEKSSVQNEEDNEEEICMQKEDAAYVGSVCDNVFRSSVHTM